MTIVDPSEARRRLATSLLMHPFLTGAAFRAAIDVAVGLANGLTGTAHALLAGGEYADDRWAARVLRAGDRAPYADLFAAPPGAIRHALVAARCISDALLCGSAKEGGEFLPTLFGAPRSGSFIEGDCYTVVQFFETIEYDAHPGFESKRLVGLMMLDWPIRRDYLVRSWNRVFRALPGESDLVEACWREGRLDIIVAGERLSEVLDRWVAEHPEAPTGVVVASALTRWVMGLPPGVHSP